MSTLAMYSRRIQRGWRGCRFGKPSLGLVLFEEGYSLDLFGLLIALPFLDRYRYQPEEILEKWGVYLDGGAGDKRWLFGSIVLCWGNWTKFIHMPWEFTHISSNVLLPDGSWSKRQASYEGNDGRKLWTFDYRYTLRSGEVQQRVATVHVERIEWRRKFLKWCPWFAKVQQGMWIEFNGEVGERTGSWKGGTIGCGWDLNPCETVENAIRRMERERVFN